MAVFFVIVFAKKGGADMDEYIRRLMMCGYRKDDAWTIVNDFLRLLDWDALEAFIEAREIVQRVGSIR